MNFLADEGVDRQIVDRLRDEGHTVLYIAEMDPGISDDSVLDTANSQSAMLITADKDFGEIVFRQRRSSGGIILIRLQGLSPEAKAAAVSEAINGHLTELSGNFSVLSPGAFRIRRRFV